MGEFLGKKYNMLTVISFSHKASYGHPMYNCVCDCGNKKTIALPQLKNSKTKSCGCYRYSFINKTTHGDAGSITHKSWSSMVERCNNPNHQAYKNYGGRGIMVCSEWGEYSQFVLDMGERPSNLHSIDRIDNNKNYEPSNCRWATKKEQANNRRTNVFIEHDGRRLTMQQWAETLGIQWSTLYRRIGRLGVEKAMGQIIA